MPKQKDDRKDMSTSGLDKVKEQLSAYVEARGQHLLDSAEGRITDLAKGLGNGADGDGAGGVLGIGKRVLGGENPLKALVGEKTGAVKDKAVDSVKSALGGGGKSGSPKVTNIVEAIDVGKPLRTVYDRWTEIEEFNSFAKGVTDVSRSDDEVESDWKLKVAFSNRSWKATVQEQIPDDRIVWTSEGAQGTTHGAITFHELAPALTRIVAVVEYTPSGFFEKTGNIWRAQGRRLRLDLKHFQRYATLTDDEEVEGWRGEIRDGEVVRSHEEGLEDDESEEDQEPDDEAEGEYEDDYEEEPEEDEKTS